MNASRIMVVEDDADLGASGLLLGEDARARCRARGHQAPHAALRYVSSRHAHKSRAVKKSRAAQAGTPETPGAAETPGTESPETAGEAPGAPEPAGEATPGHQDVGNAEHACPPDFAQGELP